MKKLFSTIVISALLCVNTFATPVVVNSEPATFEKPVIIRQSTSFLSLREIASNLLDNVNLQWNAENKTAILTSNNITVQVPIGTNYIIVNDNTRPIDANNSQVTSFIENGTTYVPIRCIAESFGYVVNYSDNTIYVSNKDTQNSTLPQFSEMKQGETIATMHTSMGDIVFRFFPQYAPKGCRKLPYPRKKWLLQQCGISQSYKQFYDTGRRPYSNRCRWRKYMEQAF